jgi:putative aminotransferase
VKTICSFCVTDDSDPNIVFHDGGNCNHCSDFRNNIWTSWNSGLDAPEIQPLSNDNRANRGHSGFDCVIGLSGVLDSSYAAHVAV